DRPARELTRAAASRRLAAWSRSPPLARACSAARREVAMCRCYTAPTTRESPPVSEARKQEFDPVTLEIFWSRLISIADESAAALLRTSFSTIVRESNDFATVLMDANG